MICILLLQCRNKVQRILTVAYLTSSGTSFFVGGTHNFLRSEMLGTLPVILCSSADGKFIWLDIHRTSELRFL